MTDEEIRILKQQKKRQIKCELFHDNLQNYKRYHIPKAQLIIADIPYNLGVQAFASNPMWYVGGDNRNGESEHAKSAFFNGDGDFNLHEYFHFCGKMLIKEPKEKNKAPCMVVFCAFEQMAPLIDVAKQNGYEHYIPLFFIKNYSAQVLKANMKIVGATEYALLFYREKLPKFNNNGRMVFNWFRWERDGKDVPKIHPTQKPVRVLKELISVLTEPGDVVIDPVAGSGSTLRAARELGRNAYGFEVSTKFYKEAVEKMLAETDQIGMGFEWT